MTSIVATLGSYLTAQPQVQTLLSAPKFGVCLWPDVVRQGAPLPCGRLQKVTGKRDFGLTEQLVDQEATVAIDIWDKTQAAADRIGETICDLLCNPPFFGLMNAGTTSELKIHFITTTAESESDEPELDASGQFEFRSHKIYKIGFDRPALDT